MAGSDQNRLLIRIHRNINNDGEDGDDDSSSVGEAEECDVEAEAITYDTALPTKHMYLGGDLEELRGRTMYDEDATVALPVMVQPIVLMPGQTLPLTILYPPTVSMLRRTISGDRTFGVVNLNFSDGHDPMMVDIGTTAEIFEIQDEEEKHTFRLKAIGRQRFKILDKQRQMDGNVAATVKILPEVVLPPVLHDVRFASLNRLRPLKRQGYLHCKFSKRDAIQTQWPAWVYSQFDAVDLSNRVEKEIKAMNLGKVALSLPSDPVELSFWIGQNFPMKDEYRLILLKMNNAIQRLRWELTVLETFRVLRCRECSNIVGRQKDIFSMSKEGIQGTYVNPAGYVHETITLHKARGIKTVNEEPSTDFSWFPGYAWTIAECRQCSKHMGWKFTATNKNLKPNSFWGLTSGSLRFSIGHSDVRTPFMDA